MNFLITGATSGLGYCVFKELSREPNNKIFIIAKNKDKLDKIKSEHKNVNIYQLDLNEIEKTKEITNKIVVDSKNKIDVLICNAGRGSFGSVTDIPLKDYLEDINVNFISHLIIIKKIYQLMIKNNLGHIINISSGTAIFGFKNTSSYSASKSSMQILIESMYLENLKNNVFPKNIFPGLINSNFDQKNKFYGKIEGVPLIKKKDVDVIAKKVIKNLFSKKLNIFCQPSPFLAFLIKVFPVIEKIRKSIF